MSAKLDQLTKKHKCDVNAIRSGWLKQNRKLIQSLKTKSKNELLSLLVEKLFELEAQKLLSDLSEEESQMKDDIIAIHQLRISLQEKKANADAKKQIEYLENMLAPAKAQKRKTEEVLARGREVNAKKKRLTKLAKRERITELLNGLYSSGEGYRMGGYKVIADWLMKKVSGYTDSTMLKTVKELAPPIRQKHKSGQ